MSGYAIFFKIIHILRSLFYQFHQHFLTVKTVRFDLLVVHIIIKDELKCASIMHGELCAIRAGTSQREI